MSNVDKMCLKLMALCLLPVVIAIPMMIGVSGVLDAFMHLGAPAPSTDFPWLIALIAAAASVSIFVVQAFRIWRWKEGKSPSCPQCGCLLSRVRDGRWGPYRKCLGCTTNHAHQF